MYVYMNVYVSMYVYFPLDIDECAVLNGGCDHQCHNGPGFYNCTCDVGYKLQSDNHTCAGKQTLNLQRYI